MDFEEHIAQLIYYLFRNKIINDVGYLEIIRIIDNKKVKIKNEEITDQQAFEYFKQEYVVEEKREQCNFDEINKSFNLDNIKVKMKELNFNNYCKEFLQVLQNTLVNELKKF